MVGRERERSEGDRKKGTQRTEREKMGKYVEQEKRATLYSTSITLPMST